MTQTEEVVVDAARPADAEAMCAIYNEAISERESTFETELRSPADFQARIHNDRFPLLVAGQRGRVIGWAGLASYSSRPCYAGIGECSVYVAGELAVAGSELLWPTASPRRPNGQASTS